MRTQIKWTIPLARKEALKFKTLSDWYYKSRGSYEFAKSKGLRQKFSKHMKKRSLLNDEIVKKEALKYKSKKEWAKNSLGTYGYAVRHRKIDKFSKHMKNPRYKKQKEITDKKEYKTKRWNRESVKQQALKYSSKKEWKYNSPSSYNFARKNNLILAFSRHMTVLRKKWTKNECIKSSKNFKFSHEWAKKCPKQYNYARKHGWLNDCLRKLIKKNKGKGYWNNVEILKKEIKKYKTRKEFSLNNGSAYTFALKNFKWLLDLQLPVIENSTTSMGEYSTKIFLEKVFKLPFIKKTHDFLINPKTGRKMELDGYCEKLNIAFEYGNHQKMKSLIPKREIDKILFKDKIKARTCNSKGIKLLQITTDSIAKKNPAEHLKNQIKKQIILNKIPIPKLFDSIKLEIVQFKNKKWNKKTIWKAVKKTKNISDLQVKYVGAYGMAVRMGIIDEIRNHYHKKNGTKQRLENNNNQKPTKQANNI